MSEVQQPDPIETADHTAELIARVEYLGKVLTDHGITFDGETGRWRQDR